MSCTKCLDDLLPAFPVSVSADKAGERIGIKNGEMLRAWVVSGKPIDKAADDMKREGEQAAARGREVFGAWWNRDDVKKHRLVLRPLLENFQSIAAEADRASEEASAPEEDDDFPGTAANPAAPFGPAAVDAA